ncbi:hypothetical protein GF391_04460 [Candidatus Uhrbacteria bacterium]|nr:hypothetical protein [Candidatus Uhrbacteria bacterium]
MFLPDLWTIKEAKVEKSPPAKRKDSPRAPIDLARVKRINELLGLFGEPKPEKIIFQAGTVLIKEGSIRKDRAAILVIEGALEERKTLVVENHGISEQVLAILREGDVANIPGIISELSGQPAHTSLHVKESGYGYILRPENIKHLDSLGILLSSALRQTGKQAEVFANISKGYSTFKLLLQNLKKDFPKIPEDPVEFLRLYQKVSRQLKELRRQSAKRSEREAELNKLNSELNDRIVALEQELSAARSQLTRSRRSKAAEQPSVLSTRVIELENANNALRRDLHQEQRTRKALEQKNAELIEEIAKQSSAVSSAKFPSAAHLLESSGLEELEQDARRFRAAADHFEDLATKMHRALDLLARDNPGMVISNDVNRLMLGEDVPLREAEQKARAHRGGENFKTVHLGSDSPEVAAARARSSSTASASEQEPKPKNMRDSDRMDTAQETPLAKHGPNAMSSQELTTQNKRRTDRHVTAVESPGALKTNRDGHRSGEHPAMPAGPLSGADMDAILQEFVDDASWEALDTGSLPNSQGINVPPPDSENTRSKTMPFIPDETHPPANSDVCIPREPPTPRVSQPVGKPVPANRGHDMRISGRYMYDSYSDAETDSDTTPTVPYSYDDPPRLRDPASSRTRAWNDEVAVQPPPKYVDPPEVCKNSGSSSIDFPDEDTDVRQIQEDWRGALRSGKKNTEPEPESDEFVIPPSADIPPPPANLFGEIEPEVDDEPELIADVDWATSGGTQAYRFDENGSVASQAKSPKDEDARTTRAYDFEAPGKPPKPQS